MTSKCHVCRGDKIVKSVDDLLLYIEKGVPDGHEYVICILSDQIEI